MPILTILIVLVVVGVLLWLVNTYVPMNGTIKKILNIVVIVAVAIWLLNVFGVFSYLSAMNYTQTKDLCVSRFIDFSNENASPCFCFKSNLRPTTRLYF